MINYQNYVGDNGNVGKHALWFRINCAFYILVKLF